MLHAQLTPSKAPSFAVPTDWNELLLGSASASMLLQGAVHLLLNLVLAALILSVTLWASKRASMLARQAIARVQRRTHADPTLLELAAMLVRYGVIAIGLIAVLQQLGVQTTSVIAVLGAASLAVGLALQGALSNVAAGVLILILRPYRIGDDVEINGRRGVVRALDLFATRLASPDSVQIFVPNGKAFGDPIVNFTTLGRRRIELDFGVDYEDDLRKGLALMIEAARADPRVLPDPPPWANVTELKDSAVNLSLKVWTPPGVWQDVRSDLIERIKRDFEREGLSFPYPHQVAVRAPDRAPRPARGAPPNEAQPARPQ